MPDKIYFYVDPKKIHKNNFTLNKQESHHLVKVLRKQIGEEIWLLNGIGTAFRAKVQSFYNDTVSGIIIEGFPKYGENSTILQIGIGLLKKDKMEYVVEKATELGVSHIFPLLLDHCIKRDINIDRMQKIIFTAAKQCGRSYFPIIHAQKALSTFLKLNNNSKYVICHASGTNAMNELLPSERKSNNIITVLIGPEGDFSQQELTLLSAIEQGKVVNLGVRRLRSETAVVTALAQINLYYN